MNKLMMIAKFNYTKPVIIVVECELNNMVATSSLDVNDEQGDEEKDFSPGRRDEWGDLWN